jgi:hypothetical protein
MMFRNRKTEDIDDDGFPPETISSERELSKDDVRPVKAGEVIKCVKGSYKGWRGQVIEDHEVMVTWRPFGRFDKMKKDRTVRKTSVVVVERSNDEVSLDDLLLSLAEGMNKLKKKGITYSNWIEVCDEIEGALFGTCT